MQFSGEYGLYSSFTEKIITKESLPLLCQGNRIKSNNIQDEQFLFFDRNLRLYLCFSSEEDDEIVECDGCGVSVHEGIYR